MQARLGDLGGTCFHPLGVADERTGLTEVEPWVQGLWPALAAADTGAPPPTPADADADAGAGAGAGASSEVAASAASEPAAAAARLLVLYGSQTGNAAAVAQRVHQAALQRGLDCACAPLNAWKSHPYDDSVGGGGGGGFTAQVIVCATTGKGEMPDNATAYAAHLAAQAQTGGSLAGVRFAVLALGDRTYKRTFCASGKLLDEQLAQAGATRLLPLAICDECPDRSGEGGSEEEEEEDEEESDVDTDEEDRRDAEKKAKDKEARAAKREESAAPWIDSLWTALA